MQRMLYVPLINVKMPTIVGIVTFMSRKKFMSHFNGSGALKAMLIKGTNYRKIDNTLYRY